MKLLGLKLVLVRMAKAWCALRRNAMHAIRMVVGALLAFEMSHLLHLPEAYWAVITVMVVARPDVANAVEAGAHRLAGTVLGSAAGIASAVARHHGVPDVWALAGMLTVIAPFSATWAEFRSAPMAGLIVSSSGPQGVAPLTVAMLRLAEIAIGIVAGVVTHRVLRRFEDTRVDHSTLVAVLESLRTQLGACCGLNAPLKREEATALRLGLRELALQGRRRRPAESSVAARRAALASDLHTGIQFVAQCFRHASTEMTDALRPQVAELARGFGDAAVTLEHPRAPTPTDADFAAKLDAIAQAAHDTAQGERVSAIVFAMRQLNRNLDALLRACAVDTAPTRTGV